MLILLPPSEGKAVPSRGAPVDLTRLAFAAELTDARSAVLAALGELCAGPQDRALSVLGLPPGRAGEVIVNRGLLGAPTLPAGALYNGVLHEHLGLATLTDAARRRANRTVLVAGGLWGLVRLTDRLPAYRLAGDVTLPGLGGLAGHWRASLGAALTPWIGRRLLLDLRSGTYAAAWRPGGDAAARSVAVRITRGGRVVSHHNKATKGLLARALLSADVDPRKPEELAETCRELGFCAQLEPAVAGRPRLLAVDETP